jgi:phenylalanyl-tRNA synthetase beta chain
MNVSRRWLEDFLRSPLEARDAANRLAMLGATVDAIEPLHADLAEIVVAQVETVGPHPNADRLRVCEVNDGTGTLRHVVCGAPNVQAGRKYPFARVGAAIPHGKDGAPMRLERAKIRGEVSDGMLCSARELGLGQEHDGILELDTDATPGTPFLQAVGLGDDRLVVDVTPNRPDLLCHKGIARELAASLGGTFRLPTLPRGQAGGEAPRADIPPARRDAATAELAGIRLSLEDLAGCRRFTAALIRGVKVGPSPAWLQRRLQAVGVRPISNVVDATNYVMLELNQPMHAYDAATLRGPAIVVRRGRVGESLVTLDGATRGIDGETTVIADAEGVIGLAGIMGGSTTEVSERTTDVLLEGAWWSPAGIRRTRRRLGMSTEASYRFERGVDLWAAPDAMRRCIELVLATAGGRLAADPVDLWPEPSHPPRIFLRPGRVAQVLGVELPVATIERHLLAIGATALSKPEDHRIAVDVPGWRPDLTDEIDLIEEVARVHGYDNFPVELRPFRVGSLPDAPMERLASQLRRGLVAEGLFEVGTLPTVPDGAPASVRLLNPTSAEDPYLRRDLLPGLIRQVEQNFRNHVRDVRLFEVGTVFEALPGERPIEARRVAAVITGAREPRHWSNTGAPDFDRWDLRGLFEAATALANPDATVQVEGNSWVAVTSGGAVAGRAAPLAADAPPWAAPVFGFELTLDPTPRAPVEYRPLPTTPASERDFALVLDGEVTAARVAALLERTGGALLERVAVLDEYHGASIGARRRSVMFRLTFRAPDRTLRDREVDELERRMLQALERELGVKRRDAAGPSAGEA